MHQDTGQPCGPITRAVILAAGQGRRLLPYTQHHPKCLLDIGGKTLLQHQINALRAVGIEHITIVTGYLGHRVREHMGTDLHYVENPLFASTDSMYSLWLARDAATHGCVILNADVLFHHDILHRLLLAPYPDALAVDFDAELAEEEVKVRVSGRRVCALSKTLLDGQAENLGLLKLSPQGSRCLFAKIAELLALQHQREMVPFAVNALAPSHFFAAVPTGGRPWIEIDFPDDYRRACDAVYPAICQES